MKRSRNVSIVRRRRQKHRGKAAQFARGLILESLGVIALVLLYFTMQSASVSPSADPLIGESPAAPSSTAQPLAQMTGHYARSWSEYHRDTVANFQRTRTCDPFFPFMQLNGIPAGR